MIKGIALPTTEQVALDALSVLSVTPVSVSPDGQKALVDVLYSVAGGQQHAFMQVDLPSGIYETNYNQIVGQGDAASIKTYTATVSWGDDDSPLVSISYQDLSDAASEGLYNRVALIEGNNLASADLIETISGEVSDGSIQGLRIDQSGRYVAFDTAATNLAPSGLLDTNTVTDVYLLDRQSNALTRISVLQDGTDATLEESLLRDIAIIEDELQILFSTTAASVFSANDQNTDADLYRWKDGEISLISANDSGSAAGYDGGVARFSGDEITFVATDLSDTDDDGQLDLYLVDAINLSKRLEDTVDSLTFSADYDVWIEDANDETLALGLDGATLGTTDINNQLIGVERNSSDSEIFSLSAGGTLADDASGGLAIGAGGNSIIFNTSATNLVPIESAFVVNFSNTAAQGSIGLSGSVRVGQTVTVDISQFSDVDGFDDGLSYEWSLNGEVLSDHSSNALELTEAMQGQLLSVTLRYTDNWNNSESLSLDVPVEVGARGIQLQVGGTTLAGGAIVAELDQTDRSIQSDSSYFNLTGQEIGTVRLMPAMHTSDIGISDVISTLRHIVGLDTLEGRAALAADVNNDEQIGISDVISQLRHIVGLDEINEFDVVDNQGNLVGDELSQHGSLELILNGDVNLSTELTPAYTEL